MVRFASLAFVSALTLASSGCFGGGTSVDAKLGTVTGRITRNGQPLPKVDVQFVPVKGGRASYATTDADGVYELVFSANAMGAVVGQHEVKITGGGGTVDLDANADADLTASTGLAIPTRYNSATELRCEVKSGENEYDVDLEFNATN